jgi:hypothetical protein
MAEAANPRRVYTAVDGWVLAALVGLMYCVYLLVASFTFVSGDELFLFDAVESIARHGAVSRSETADLEWPGESQAEPAQLILAAPLYWIVNSFDGIGNVHGTLLFNPIVTALTGGLVYLYVRRLEYDCRVAAVAAAAFGLTTIVLPYTKTFFREPLAMLSLFATAFGLLNWREAMIGKERLAYGWLIFALAAGLVAFFAKEANFAALPVLLLLLLPGRASLRRSSRDWLRLLGFLAIAIVIGGLGLWLFNSVFDSVRFDPLPRLQQALRHAPFAAQGIMGFLISPGKSLFLFSPVLILALTAPLLGGRRQFDASWPLALLVVFVVVYAFVRGELWWGGTNWGPRYMVPLTPFLIVSAAPFFDYALNRSRFGLFVLLGLCTVGLAVQVGGVGVHLGKWDSILGGAKEGGPWMLGLWEARYSAIIGHWRLLASEPLDFAWARALPGGPAWTTPILAGGLAIIFAIAIGYGVTASTMKRRVATSGMMIGFLLAGAVTWFSLRSIYFDQRYRGNDESLHQLNGALRNITAPGPVIFLNNSTYFGFMLNYYKGQILWYTLPLNSREMVPPGTPPLPRDTDPRSLVRGSGIIEFFSQPYQTIFLITERGPFTPESPRPTEWWLSRNYHYIGVQEFSPIVRLVEFSSAVAPKPALTAAHAVEYQLGDHIALLGWDAQPDGAPLRPGGILNLSTQWKALSPPDAEYKIGMYLIDSQGALALQDDSLPVNGFWPTSAWQAGDVIRHNVAFALPKDLSPGFYEVWTLMYSATDGARLPVRDSSGTNIRDHIVLFTVEVTR